MKYKTPETIPILSNQYLKLQISSLTKRKFHQPITQFMFILCNLQAKLKSTDKTFPITCMQNEITKYMAKYVRVGDNVLRYHFFINVKKLMRLLLETI